MAKVEITSTLMEAIVAAIRQHAYSDEGLTDLDEHARDCANSAVLAMANLPADLMVFTRSVVAAHTEPSVIEKPSIYLPPEARNGDA